MPYEPTEIAAQVQWLVDIEQIKQLKARYAAACDNDYDPEAIAALFTEDAVWDGGMMGFAETRQGIFDFFQAASSLVGFAVHGLSNPIIEVDGDTASGTWYLTQPMVMKGTTSAYWFSACYADTYIRTADGWKFKHVKITERAFSPYEEGFGKTLMAPLPV